MCGKHAAVTVKREQMKEARLAKRKERQLAASSEQYGQGGRHGRMYRAEVPRRHVHHMQHMRNPRVRNYLRDIEVS
jgi:ribosomal protein L44E